MKTEGRRVPPLGQPQPRRDDTSTRATEIRALFDELARDDGLGPQGHEHVRGRTLHRSMVAVAVTVVGVAVATFVLTNHAYITTPSMYPSIPPGSMVLMEKQPVYHVGEVIEFRANGLLWVHRLVAIKPNGDFVTKGDNPESTDDVFAPATTARDVVGAVAVSVPYLGFPELFVHDPGYALGWLRAELGIAGRLGLVAVVAVLASLLLLRRRTPPRARKSDLRGTQAPV